MFAATSVANAYILDTRELHCLKLGHISLLAKGHIGHILL